MDADPRFPDRPQHPDFERLSEVVINNDLRSELGQARQVMEETVDMTSVKYLASQRTAKGWEQRMGFPPVREIAIGLTASWCDGFVAGVHFQQAGGHVDAQ